MFALQKGQDPRWPHAEDEPNWNQERVFRFEFFINQFSEGFDHTSYNLFLKHAFCLRFILFNLQTQCFSLNSMSSYLCVLQAGCDWRGKGGRWEEAECCHCSSRESECAGKWDEDEDEVHCQRGVLLYSSLQDPHFIFLNSTEQCALVLPGGLWWYCRSPAFVILRFCLHLIQKVSSILSVAMKEVLILSLMSLSEMRFKVPVGRKRFSHFKVR